MDFKNDLIEIVKAYFREEDIACTDGDATHFATRYCEMEIRRIPPRRREESIFSSEIHGSLGRLLQRTGCQACPECKEGVEGSFQVAPVV